MVSLLFNIFSSCPFTYQTDFKCMCLSVRYLISKCVLYFVEQCIYHFAATWDFSVHGSACGCCWCSPFGWHSIDTAEFVLIFFFSFRSFLLLFIRDRDSLFTAATTTTMTMRTAAVAAIVTELPFFFFISFPCFQHTIAFLSWTEQWRQPNYKRYSFERR